MRNLYCTSKRLDSWKACASKATDTAEWYKHSCYCIVVDSQDWGVNQIYEEQTQRVSEINEDWINAKINQIKNEKHITKATITLYRALYSYSTKAHCYKRELIPYRIIDVYD